MIKINLLPFRAAKKRENIKRQITIFFGVVVALLLAMTYFFINLNSELTALQTQQKQLSDELAGYEKTLARIAELEKKSKEIKSKLDVIKDLEKKKTGPILLLDEIAMAVPKDKLWLTSLSETAGVLKLTGTAMDNETVALFMTNLEKSPHITSVELQSARLTNLAQYRLNVSDFTLECKTYAFKEKPKAAPKPARKR
ncbi:MAG: PilN domain-containing protein [Deltaproteobacteria bacterium]|nr:PilN domain-containing protein [Deltaproteobacteria bacterium]